MATVDESPSAVNTINNELSTQKFSVLTVEGLLDHHKISCIIDTGATDNVVDQNFLSEPWEKVPTTALKVAGSQLIPVLGQKQIEIKFKGALTCKVTCLVV